MAADQWKIKQDLSKLKSIQWGKEKDAEARRQYEEKTGNDVICCGIFISTKNSLFAASPDGIVKQDSGSVLIEIKCPASLREVDLESQLPDTFNSDFLDKQVCLKRNHQYMFQIQLGMYVTGCRKTHFVV